jgi:outer membrane protein TolC
MLWAAPLLLLGAPVRAADMTVSSYTALALASSPDVRTAFQAFNAADEAYSAQLANSVLPTLSFTGLEYPYGDNPANGYAYQPFRIRTGDMAFNTSVDVNLFNSFQDFEKNHNAALARDSAQHAWLAAKQNAALAAIQAFYDLDMKVKLTAVANVNLGAQNDQYQQSLDLYKNGMKSLADLLKSETDWRSSQLRLLDAVQAEKLSRVAFNTLIDRPGLEPAELKVDLEPGATALPLLDADMPKALAQRPEILKARKDLERAQVAVVQAIQGALPGLRADFTWNHEDQPALGVSNTTLGIPNPYYYLGLSLSLPVGFNIVAQVYAVKQAQAAKRQADEALAAAIRQVRIDLYGAYVGLEHDVESYELALKKEEIAQKTLDLVSDEYRQDTADAIRMNLAQSDLLDAQVSRTQDLHAIFTDRAQYRRATGEPLW